MKRPRREPKEYWERIDKQAREEGVCCFLQNAWSPLYAGRVWPRESWLRALRDSRSGKRLRLLVSNPAWCHNTTPVVGARPSSRPPADHEHIQRILEDYQPRVVIACGGQAEDALRELWDSTLLVVPHPAYRVLTDDLYREARLELDTMLAADALGESGSRVALRQLRRGVEKNKL